MSPQQTAATISANSTAVGLEASKKDAASPFLKWAGGKGQLLSQLAPLFPATYTFRLYFVYTVRQLNYPDEPLRGYLLNGAQFTSMYTPSNRRLNNA